MEDTWELAKSIENKKTEKDREKEREEKHKILSNVRKRLIARGYKIPLVYIPEEELE